MQAALADVADRWAVQLVVQLVVVVGAADRWVVREDPQAANIPRQAVVDAVPEDYVAGDVVAAAVAALVAALVAGHTKAAGLVGLDVGERGAAWAAAADRAASIPDRLAAAESAVVHKKEPELRAVAAAAAADAVVESAVVHRKDLEPWAAAAVVAADVAVEFVADRMKEPEPWAVDAAAAVAAFAEVHKMVRVRWVSVVAVVAAAASEEARTKVTEPWE